MSNNFLDFDDNLLGVKVGRWAESHGVA